MHNSGNDKGGKVSRSFFDTPEAVRVKPNTKLIEVILSHAIALIVGAILGGAMVFAMALSAVAKMSH